LGLHLYLLVIALYTTAVAWISVAVHARTRWRETQVGRHLMAYMLGLALTFTALTIGVVAEYELPLWLEHVRAVLYLSAPIVVTWRLVLQIQARHHPLVDQEEDKETP
jgi:hypothetical protein